MVYCLVYNLTINIYKRIYLHHSPLNKWKEKSQPKYNTKIVLNLFAQVTVYDK